MVTQPRITPAPGRQGQPGTACWPAACWWWRHPAAEGSRHAATLSCLGQLARPPRAAEHSRWCAAGRPGPDFGRAARQARPFSCSLCLGAAGRSAKLTHGHYQVDAIAAELRRRRRHRSWRHRAVHTQQPLAHQTASFVLAACRRSGSAQRAGTEEGQQMGWPRRLRTWRQPRWRRRRLRRCRGREAEHSADNGSGKSAPARTQGCRGPA